MFFNRKFFVITLVSIFTIIGIAATKAPEEEHLYKNLKVLPKNTTKEQLDKVMDNFKVSLGVKCNFCHAPSKDTAVHHPDFASDEKPEKNIAREMMKMTAKINKKFFADNKNEQGERVAAVECMTCHHGKERPLEEHK
jgi:hypothetical protein